jgi:PhnB protein
MIITPVLHFYGQCEEAVELYGKAFNCKLDILLRYSDADKRDWDVAMTEEQKNYIYHSEFYIGSQRFMMADELEGEQTKVTTIFMTITFDTAEEVKKAYDVLEAEGTVIYPFHSTTYCSCMGSLIDKFGFRWSLMTEQTER